MNKARHKLNWRTLRCVCIKSSAICPPATKCGPNLYCDRGVLWLFRERSERAPYGGAVSPTAGGRHLPTLRHWICVPPLPQPSSTTNGTPASILSTSPQRRLAPLSTSASTTPTSNSTATSILRTPAGPWSHPSSWNFWKEELKRRILFCTITININIKTIKLYNILSCSRIFVSWINLRPRAATHSNYTDVTRAASCAAARATGPLRSPFCMGARGWTCQ